jgi:hypothetical protein
MRILLFFASLILFATMYSCRKQKNVVSVSPEAMPDFPTENLEDSYLLHGKIYIYLNGNYTLVDGITTDEINVINDTTIAAFSEINYNSNEQLEYKLAAYNDSELIFSRSKITITYKLKRNLIVWKSGLSVLYGVPGQTDKWKFLHDAKLNEARLWNRTKTDYYGNKEILPDTIASAILLFKTVSGQSLWLAGADSTGVVYCTSHYNAGPNEFSINGNISYFGSNDSISMRSSPVSPFQNSCTFDTK